MRAVACNCVFCFRYAFFVLGASLLLFVRCVLFLCRALCFIVVCCVIVFVGCVRVVFFGCVCVCVCCVCVLSGVLCWCLLHARASVFFCVFASSSRVLGLVFCVLSVVIVLCLFLVLICCCWRRL